MKTKFDFTGEEGIRQAFQTCFSKANARTNNRNEDLFFIEQCRHLIQHRAAIVDSKFVHHTKLNCAVGTKLSLTAQQLTDTATTIISAGLANIKLVDDWYAENKPELCVQNILLVEENAPQSSAP